MFNPFKKLRILEERIAALESGARTMRADIESLRAAQPAGPDSEIIGRALSRWFQTNGINRKKAAADTGLPADAVRAVASGARMASHTEIHALCAAYGFNPEFLRTGKGSLLPSQEKKKKDRNRQSGKKYDRNTDKNDKEKNQEKYYLTRFANML